jgi:hypothetical protein
VEVTTVIGQTAPYLTAVNANGTVAIRKGDLWFHSQAVGLAPFGQATADSNQLWIGVNGGVVVYVFNRDSWEYRDFFVQLPVEFR